MKSLRNVDGDCLNFCVRIKSVVNKNRANQKTTKITGSSDSCRIRLDSGVKFMLNNRENAMYRTVAILAGGLLALLVAQMDTVDAVSKCSV